MIPRKTVFMFIFGGIAIFALLVFSSAFRQGWFAPHDEFTIEFPSGDGLNEGTPVSMSGLKAGRVTSVDLADQNRVFVKVSVQRRFATRIREDSKATVGRPFIIGEKAVSITPGSMNKPQIRAGSHIMGEESLEITDMLSGGRLGPYMATFSKLLDQIRVVIEGDGNDQTNLIEVYKQVYRTLKSVDTVAKEITTIRKDFAVTPEMQKVVKDVSRSTGDIQKLLAQLNDVMPAMTKLSGGMADIMPDLAKTLSETTLTLQAMQKSFVLRGAVADVKEERAKAAASERRPASVPDTKVEDVDHSK